jgi:hypothetical protein
VHEEKDDCPILDQLGVLGKEGAGLEKTGQASPAKDTESQEVSSSNPLAAQIEHGLIIGPVVHLVMRIVCFFPFFSDNSFLDLPSSELLTHWKG